MLPEPKPWGRTLHSTCLHSVPPAACGTCWSVALLYFGLGFLPKNTLAWEEQSNKNLGHNWAKLLWENMGMGASRFPTKWCSIHYSDPTADLHRCDIRMTHTHPPLHIYISELSILFNCQEGISLPHCSKQRQQEQNLHFCMREGEQKFLLLFTRTLDKIIHETAVDPDWEGNQSLLHT